MAKAFPPGRTSHSRSRESLTRAERRENGASCPASVATPCPRMIAPQPRNESLTRLFPASLCGPPIAIIGHSSYACQQTGPTDYQKPGRVDKQIGWYRCLFTSATKVVLSQRTKPRRNACQPSVWPIQHHMKSFIFTLRFVYPTCDARPRVDRHAGSRACP